MKILGITRNIDELGRITLPMELRKTFRIKEKDPLEIYVEGGVICLKPVNDVCDGCGEEKEKLAQVGKVKLCRECIDSIDTTGCEQ